MVTIEKCSEYNVRVMKTTNFKNKVHGYNFSYPAMNTIDEQSKTLFRGYIQGKCDEKNLCFTITKPFDKLPKTPEINIWCGLLCAF